MYTYMYVHAFSLWFRTLPWAPVMMHGFFRGLLVSPGFVWFKVQGGSGLVEGAQETL